MVVHGQQGARLRTSCVIRIIARGIVLLMLQSNVDDGPLTCTQEGGAASGGSAAAENAKKVAQIMEMKSKYPVSAWPPTLSTTSDSVGLTDLASPQDNIAIQTFDINYYNSLSPELQARAQAKRNVDTTSYMCAHLCPPFASDALP